MDKDVDGEAVADLVRPGTGLTCGVETDCCAGGVLHLAEVIEGDVGRHVIEASRTQPVSETGVRDLAQQLLDEDEGATRIGFTRQHDRVLRGEPADCAVDGRQPGCLHATVSFEADGDLGIACDISHCHCQPGQQQVLGVGPVSGARGPEDLLAEARIEFHLEHTRLAGGPGEPRLGGAGLHLVPVVVFLGNDPFPIRVESGRPLDERGRWRGQVDTLVSLGPPNGRRQVVGEDAPRHPVDDKVVGAQQ